MNILFLADPKSHDIKWIQYLCSSHTCFVLLRNLHYNTYSQDELTKIEGRYNIKILGGVDDFSIKAQFRTWKSMLLIKQEIVRYNIDIFHIMYAEPNALWSLFRNLWKVPIIITTRGTDILKTIPNFYLSTSFFKRIVYYLYKLSFVRADRITCTSLLQKKNVIELFGYPCERILIIRTGVEYKKVEEYILKKESSSIAFKKYVFFPRSMKSIYNHEFSIKSIALLPESILKDYHFVFIGKDSGDKEYVSKIEKLMASYDKCNFLFLNQRTENEIFNLYRYSSLVIMNPISDGTPVSALEAIAFRKPVILGPLNYDKDLFGKHVIRLSQWDENELAQKITQVLTGQIQINTYEVYNFFKAKVDRQYQMEIMNDIYKNLKAKN